MRRSRIRYSELTSLLDVLFIIVFAALVQAAGLVAQAREGALAKPSVPPKRPDRPAQPSPDAGVPKGRAISRTDTRLDPAALRRRAAAAVVAASARSGVVQVDVSAAGRLTRLTVKASGTSRSFMVDVPLLERVPDPDVGVAYLGHRVKDLRVCSAIRRALGWQDLKSALVVIRPARPLAQLKVALVEGLRADQQRCYPEERGLAVLIDSNDAERGAPNE